MGLAKTLFEILKGVGKRVGIGARMTFVVETLCFAGWVGQAVFAKVDVDVDVVQAGEEAGADADADADVVMDVDVDVEDVNSTSKMDGSYVDTADARLLLGCGCDG